MCLTTRRPATARPCYGARRVSFQPLIDVVRCWNRSQQLERGQTRHLTHVPGRMIRVFAMDRPIKCGIGLNRQAGRFLMSPPSRRRTHFCHTGLSSSQQMTLATVE